MAIKWINEIWTHSPEKGSALLVHLALADYANDDGKCWPSVATIAKKARITDRQVRRVFNVLTAKKLIDISFRVDTSSIYQLYPCQNVTPDVGVRSTPDIGSTTPDMGVSQTTTKASIKKQTMYVREFSLKVFDLWPRRDAKEAAVVEIEKFLKANAPVHLSNVELAAKWLGNRVKRAADIYRNEGTPKDKIPHLRTWMHQKRYNDDHLQTNYTTFKSATIDTQELTEAEKRRKAARGK